MFQKYQIMKFGFFRWNEDIQRNFSLPPAYCQISIKIEVRMDSKKVPECFSYINEGMLNNSAKNNPLKRKLHGKLEKVSSGGREVI